MLSPALHKPLLGMEEAQPVPGDCTAAQGQRGRRPHTGCRQTRAHPNAKALTTGLLWAQTRGGSSFPNKSSAQEASGENPVRQCYGTWQWVSKAFFRSVHPLVTACLLSFHVTAGKSKKTNPTLQMRHWILLLREQHSPSAKLLVTDKHSSALIRSYSTAGCCTRSAAIIYPSFPHFSSIASLFTG